MQLRLLDILADPDDPSQWPLELVVFKQDERDRPDSPPPHQTTGLLCKFYCYRYKQYLVSDPLGPNEHVLPKDKLSSISTYEECLACIKTEVIDGVLHSKSKWFFIDREIPVMYPLELRDAKQEQEFIDRYGKACSEQGINAPFNEQK